ncbi:hypothetical protein NZK32_17190 [Cyanobium sp. FGCU-52]|nr:hypothetical protein [Cyanobium sp. FGCU52]
MKRTVPNLPGALIHHLRRSLSIDPTTAMRVALLYGDLEWQAEGASELRWSARDYARRHGFSRNTVRADLERLEHHGAISIHPDGSESCIYRLYGLGSSEVPVEQGGGSTVEPPFSGDPGSIPEPPGSHAEPPPGSNLEPPPGSPAEPPLAQTVSHPWLNSCATLEKNFQKEEKRRGKRSRGKTLSPNSRIRFGSKASKQAPRSSRPEEESSAEDSPAQRQIAVQAQQGPQDHEGRQGHGRAPAPSSGALQAELLACFQRHCPAEWTAPQRLSLTRGRSARHRRALEHAGGSAALLARLELALAQVPPWFRRTYPLLPDGSRRPSHQFFDLLFRATGAERDAGPEAWHLFAWSESRSAVTRPEAAAGGSAADPELERALALLAWDGHHWRGQGVAALQLSRGEKRRLAELLEAAGYGQSGAAARQYGEPDREGEIQSTPAAAS